MFCDTGLYELERVSSFVVSLADFLGSVFNLILEFSFDTKTSLGKLFDTTGFQPLSFISRVF